MQTKELRSGQLVQLGRELYRINAVDPERVTAQVLYPKPPRTMVRTLTGEEISALAEPTKNLFARCETAWGFR